FWHNAGEAHLNLGEYDKAIEMFEKALSIDTTHAPSQEKLGQAKEMREWDE
ncbi:MAG: hypothetical protein CUN57_00510, partial [Phototrophicales bacterium]